MGLLAAALWDLAHRKPEEVRGDRRMWAGLVFINWIGPIAYFAIGRRKPDASPLADAAKKVQDLVSDTLHR